MPIVGDATFAEPTFFDDEEVSATHGSDFNRDGIVAVEADQHVSGPEIIFEIDSLLGITTGNWVYDITISNVSNIDSIQGQKDSTDVETHFAVRIDNLSNQFQWVDFTFHPRLKDPRTGLAYCDHGNALDTTIRIYIEPKPEGIVTPIYDTICSGSTLLTVGG